MKQLVNLKISTLALLICMGIVAGPTSAALTDLATTPMGTATTGEVVKPNVFYLMDTSGSTGSDYFPDMVFPPTDLGIDPKKTYTCRDDADGVNRCEKNETPFNAIQFNGLAYNPNFTYRPGVNWDGSSRGSFSGPWTSVPQEAYDATEGVTALDTKFRQMAYCPVSGCSKGYRFNGIRAKTFSYATPKKASVPGVAFARSGSTVTGTLNGHGIEKGDMIDVVGAGNCSASAVIVTNATTSNFTYTWGDANTLPTGACTNGTVNYSVIGLPEPTGVTFKVKKDALKKTDGSKTVTITFPGHGLLFEDMIDVTPASGSSVCTAAGLLVKAVTDTTITYDVSSSSGTCAAVDYTITRRPFKYRKTTTNQPPYYYIISATEYCADEHLIDCVASTKATTKEVGGTTRVYKYPAYVRYCSSLALAQQAPPVTTTSGTALCIDRFWEGKYIYPRYGMFTRHDIMPAITQYYDRPNRSDCKAAPICTYQEEMTNFANWYAYYRKRIAALKTATGLAFQSIDDRYRVGFAIIEPSKPVKACTGTNLCTGLGLNAEQFLPIATFDSLQKQKFYNILYNQTSDTGTPLRAALARAGRYYAHKTDGINSGMNDDPVQYSCQQNFTLLTTDGYWKGTDGFKLDGKTLVGNQDGKEGTYVSREAGTYDGGCPDGNVEEGGGGGCANTLADVAQYYYVTDLRDEKLWGNSKGALGTDVSENNVNTDGDETKANWQHMVTFTLGLADGLMKWRPDYDKSQEGDFARITTGANTCYWTGNAKCNWPVVVEASATALDDLWHTAVNGRGRFYHAKDSETLVSGLSGALAGMSAKTASAAAAATSSPNITKEDNVIYSTTYETVSWSGELVAQHVSATDGTVQEKKLWSAQETLDAMVSDTSDSRTIFTFDVDASDKKKDFAYAQMTAAEKAWFASVCIPVKLSQCPNLSIVQHLLLLNGEYLVNFLRGRTEHEGGLFRDREHVLGDTVNATPTYVRAPLHNFADATTPSYAEFKSSQASRKAVLYLAANDGMLHAIDATVGSGSKGTELWAYVPRIVMPNLYKLADKNYSHKHAYFVDGSPSVMDIYANGSWKTILVGGLNSGGRGYYALDITDPAGPRPLWEFCSDSNLCPISDANLGYSYGNPVITKWKGEWVVLVTSGYNNVAPGDGKGYLYILDAVTGTIKQKLSTNVGSTTTPSGLGRIAAWADNFKLDNTAKYVYGGDLRGNLWRFDLSASSPTVLNLGVLTDSGNKPQPITTRPELASLNGQRVVYVGTGKFLGITDLTPSETEAYQQTLYAIKDAGIAYGNIRDSGNLVKQELTAGELTRTVTTNTVSWTDNNGWYVDFNPAGSSPGERVTVDPQLTLGTLNVKTNVPNASACTFGGDSWFYQFRYDTGSFVSTSPNQVVGQKLTGVLIVGSTIVGTGVGLRDIVIDNTGKAQVFGVNVGVTGSSGRRIGWREITK